MLKKQWMWFPAALLALSLAACGNEDKKLTTCKVDKDCDSAEICHPHAGVCVRTCASSGDCLNSAKECKEIFAGEEQKICKCQTTELCNDRKPDGDLVCNPIYNVCVSKDLKIGLEGPGQDVDDRCNPENPQPDVCKYGLFCSDEVCEDKEHCKENQCAPTPTSVACNEKFQKLTWNPFSPTGPVIYTVEPLGYDRWPGYCGTDYRNLQFRVLAYSTDEMLPPGNDPPLRLYKSPNDSTVLRVGGEGLVSSGWVNDGDNHVTITINLCRLKSSTDYYVAGLAFDHGNPVCLTQEYQPPK